MEADGLIARAPSPENAKRLELSLTETGRAVFADLNAASAEEIAALIGPLCPAERRQLVQAMQRIRRLLGDTLQSTVTLDGPQPGDLGAVVAQHGALYAAEYGFDWRFEALVAEIVGSYVHNHISGKERCWIARREGDVIGSVFVVRQDDATAKLRLLYVDPSARGQGLGRRLVEECLSFARAAGYGRMTLWTNNNLTTALKLYEATGFALVKEEPHHSFGQDLVGQTWERDL